MKKLTFMALGVLMAVSSGKAIARDDSASRLRECVADCIPSMCATDAKLAKRCAKLCKGHETSLARLLYKKCSGYAAGLRPSAAKGNQAPQPNQQDLHMAEAQKKPVWLNENQPETLEERTVAQTAPVTKDYGPSDAEMRMYSGHNPGDASIENVMNYTPGSYAPSERL